MVDSARSPFSDMGPSSSSAFLSASSSSSTDGRRLTHAARWGACRAGGRFLARWGSPPHPLWLRATALGARRRRADRYRPAHPLLDSRVRGHHARRHIPVKDPPRHCLLAASARPGRRLGVRFPHPWRQPRPGPTRLWSPRPRSNARATHLAHSLKLIRNGPQRGIRPAPRTMRV